MEKIKQLKEEKKEELQNTICDRIADYDEGYICDIISEISDNSIDIYTTDLLDWAKYNYEYIDRAIEELGSPNDFISSIQQGQFLYYQEELYNNLGNMLLLFAYNHLYENDISLNNDQLEELDDFISGLDNNDLLEDIIDKIEELSLEERGANNGEL